MKGFDRLPVVSDEVYERVLAERKAVGRSEQFISVLVGTWFGLIEHEKGRLLDGIISVGAVKPKQREEIAFDIYWLLRLINDALAETKKEG